MALETSHQLQFRKAVYDLLDASSVYEDVQISMFPLDPGKALSPAWIELWETTMDAEWTSLGNLRQEERFSLSGRIVVLMAGAGPEQQIELIVLTETYKDELETIIRQNHDMPTMAGAITACLISEIETVPLYTAEGLVLLVPFTISVLAELRNS